MTTEDSAQVVRRTRATEEVALSLGALREGPAVTDSYQLQERDTTTLVTVERDLDQGPEKDTMGKP